MIKDIKIIRKLKNASDSIALAVGNEKIPAIVDAYEDKDVAAALTMLLDPMITFGIGEKSLDRNIEKCPIIYFETLNDICMYLSRRNGISDQDICSVQDYLNEVRNIDNELYEFVRNYITKTLTIGATAKTVNKALGREAIPEFKCMLANKYFEHQKEVEGKEFTLTLKMDGIRCLCVVKNGEATFYTRQGQVIDGLGELSNEVTKLSPHIVFDGELLIDGGLQMESKTAYKLTTKAVRKDGEKSGITYHIFDLFAVSDLSDKESVVPYKFRRRTLNNLMVKIDHLDMHHVQIVPSLYCGEDTDKIVEILNQVRAQNQEGVMINIDDAPYQFKRTNDLLKVKVMQDADLLITGVQEGTGKFKGTLGSIIVDYKGNPVGVGSGLSDEIRNLIWKKPDQYIGRIATIQYFEETTDKTGKPSIRFPVFKEIREIDKEVSYN